MSAPAPCLSLCARFVGKPLYFGSRLPPETIQSVLDHIAEGCGVRQTGRLCKVSRGTVGRLSRIADDPADDRKGDTWNHVAIDAGSRLVISVVPGERTAENVAAAVEDFNRRAGGRVMSRQEIAGRRP